MQGSNSSHAAGEAPPSDAEDAGPFLSSTDLDAARSRFHALAAREVPTLAVLPDGMLGLCTRSSSLSTDSLITARQEPGAAKSAGGCDAGTCMCQQDAVSLQMDPGHSMQHSMRCSCRGCESMQQVEGDEPGAGHGDSANHRRRDYEDMAESGRLDCVAEAVGTCDSMPLLRLPGSSAAPMPRMPAASIVPAPSSSTSASHDAQRAAGRGCAVCREAELLHSMAERAAPCCGGRCAGVGGEQQGRYHGVAWGGRGGGSDAAWAGGGSSERSAVNADIQPGACCAHSTPAREHSTGVAAPHVAVYTGASTSAAGMPRCADCAVPMGDSGAATARRTHGGAAVARPRWHVASAEAAAAAGATASDHASSDGTVALSESGSAAEHAAGVGAGVAGGSSDEAAAYYFYRKTLCMDDFVHALRGPCLSMQRASSTTGGSSLGAGTM
eukprot:jgi/Ulvmu1/5488/UM023_0024.1